MVVLCATLTALQYRWTGALARAEMERLRGNLGEQTQQLARAFDAELTAGCAQLLPTAAEIDRLGREPAHAARLHQWLAGKPRPIFRRLAVAVPEGATLQLFALEQKSARFALMEWPPEWSELRDNLMRKLAMGSPPYLDREGMLLEFPIFGGRERGESEWTIFELDRTYLCDTWLPSLVRKHLNPDGTPLHSVLVKTVTTPASTLYASDDGQAAREETPVVIRFNREGRDAGDFPGQP